MDERHEGGAFEGARYDDARFGGSAAAWRRAIGRHGRRAPALAGYAARVTVWSLVHFLFGLAQQLAELLAPFALVIGVGWYALPRVLGLIQTGDGQMQGILDGLADHVPSNVAVGGHVFTPGGLVFDGLLLMAVAAALSTLSAFLSREIYRRP